MADFSNSNVDSRYNVHSDSEDEPYLRFIVVGKKCHQNQNLLTALQEFDAEIEISDTGFEFMHEAQEDTDTCTVFVLDNFEGDVFTRLHRSHCRIIGPTVVIKCAQNHQRLPKNTRPLYCTAMHELVLCFTGFRIKEDLSRLADLVHHMGGSIRKDISKNVTHLVANSTKGEKYTLAISFGLSIMTEDWIHQCWEQRENINLRADDEVMMQYKVSPFYFCVISTYGFTKEEERDIENQVVQYGGSFVECGAPSATHLVVSSNVHELDIDVHPGVHVVTDEWIWESVMLSACARESQYRWARDQGKFKTPGTPGTPRANSATPKTMSGSKSRKRKKLKENLAQLASEGEVDTPMYKRRSSEMGHLSCGQSFLDVTPDVSAAQGVLQDKTLNRENSVSSTSPSAVGTVQKEPVKWTARHNTIMELFQTEKNYVGILHTILKLFKEEIEKPDQRGGPILDPTDVKMIFGKIPPIYDAHMKIRDSLNELVTNEWDENCSVGDIFIRNIEQFVKSYPPFVNFFSSIKESIKHCDKTKPRFHAFLKICQSKPECGRQSLTDLLIRLVQRLPSVILLLKEIHKKTDPSNPDKEKLEKAYTAVEDVMKLINEDKKTTELYQMFFEVFNEIENAPADLLASSRTLLQKVDVVEISDVMHGRGENATVFLLSDQIEMCKRRVKVLNAKSPGNHIGSKTPKQQAYKHIVQVPFNHVKRVLNIKDTQECKNIFGLITREGQEPEKLYAFTIVDESVKKEEFLQMICKEVAAYKFRVDHESLLATVDATMIDLQLDFTDLGASKMLGKAAARFGKRVSRAFSFKQTPRKLKRAISSMVMQSPINRRDSTASMNSMTPGGSGLTRGSRMASCNDLADESCFMKENLKFPDFDQLSMGTPSRSYYHDTISEDKDSFYEFDENIDNVSMMSLDVGLQTPQNLDDRGFFSLKKRCRSNTIATGCNFQITHKRKTFDDQMKSHNHEDLSKKLEFGSNKNIFQSEQNSNVYDLEHINFGESLSTYDFCQRYDIPPDWNDMGYYSRIIWKAEMDEKSPNNTKMDEINLKSFVGREMNDSNLNEQYEADDSDVSTLWNREKVEVSVIVSDGAYSDSSAESSVSDKWYSASEDMNYGDLRFNHKDQQRCDIYGENKGLDDCVMEEKDGIICTGLPVKKGTAINNQDVSEADKKKMYISGLKRRSLVLGELIGSLKSKKKRNSLTAYELAKDTEGVAYHKSPRKKLQFHSKCKSLGNFNEVAEYEKESLGDKKLTLENITTRKRLSSVKKQTSLREKAFIKNIRGVYKDSPIKKMISHGTSKYARHLKEKFIQYSQEDSVLAEGCSDVDTSIYNTKKWVSPPKVTLQCCSTEKTNKSSLIRESVSCYEKGIKESTSLHNQELDEISIGSSIAPSFTSEINIASNSTKESWRRETLAVVSLDHINEAMSRIDECETDSSQDVTMIYQHRRERFKKPRRLSSIFSNGNSPISSLQGTPLFPRKAATISSGTSKKYFP